MLHVPESVVVVVVVDRNRRCNHVNNAFILADNWRVRETFTYMYALFCIQASSRVPVIGCLTELALSNNLWSVNLHLCCLN